jgi:hypothetical protein
MLLTPVVAAVAAKLLRHLQRLSLLAVVTGAVAVAELHIQQVLRPLAAVLVATAVVVVAAVAAVVRSQLVLSVPVVPADLPVTPLVLVWPEARPGARRARPAQTA